MWSRGLLGVQTGTATLCKLVLGQRHTAARSFSQGPTPGPIPRMGSEHRQAFLRLRAWRNKANPMARPVCLRLNTCSHAEKSS